MSKRSLYTRREYKRAVCITDDTIIRPTFHLVK